MTKKTKKELVEEGKAVGLSLDMKMLKKDMEDAITNANKKTTEKKSTATHDGEGGFGK